MLLLSEASDMPSIALKVYILYSNNNHRLIYINNNYINNNIVAVIELKPCLNFGPKVNKIEMLDDNYVPKINDLITIMGCVSKNYNICIQPDDICD